MSDLIRELPSAELASDLHQSSKFEAKEERKKGIALRKTGEWIFDEGDTVCSICGIVLQDWTQGIFYSFCPNCGADMRQIQK